MNRDAKSATDFQPARLPMYFNFSPRSALLPGVTISTEGSDDDR